jgi:hypothetical protein
MLDQPQWIKRLDSFPPLLLDLVGQDPREQHPLPWRFRLVIHATFVFALNLLGLEFHRRLKTVDQQPLSVREFAELLIRQFTHEPIMAHHFPHDRSIFLFHMSIIIGTFRAAASKGDLFVLAIGQQCAVDELATIIRVQAQHRKWQQRTNLLDGSEHGFWTPIQ